MSYNRCLCGILPIKTGAWIVAFIDLIVSSFLLPTITLNAWIWSFYPNDNHPSNAEHTKYRDMLGDVFHIVTVISLIVITIVKLILLFVLINGIRKENEKHCKPWLWLNVVLLWFMIVSSVASAVVSGIIYNWTMFPIAIFALAFPIAFCAYLLFVIHSFMKSIR